MEKYDGGLFFLTRSAEHFDWMVFSYFSKTLIPNIRLDLG